MRAVASNLLFLAVTMCASEVAARSFQFVPSQSQLTYFESGERIEPFVCPNGHCDLELEGTFALEIDTNARTAEFMDVDVRLMGMAPEAIDNAWLIDLLENRFESILIEDETRVVFEHTASTGLLTVEIDGSRLSVSGGFDLRPVDGDGVAIQAAANLVVPEPSTHVPLFVGVLVLATRRLRRRSATVTHQLASASYHKPQSGDEDGQANHEIEGVHAP